MDRLAVMSLHTSPLAQPGQGDSGGMNVYVRELVAALAHTGVDCRVFVRRWNEDLPDVVEVEPGFRVEHIRAGAVDLSKEQLPDHVGEFTDEVGRRLEADPVDAIHANYWLSGVAGHRLKHELDLPLVSTFHTLARVKAETGDPEPDRRVRAETDVIRCSDAILANAAAEAEQLIRLYDAPAERIWIVPPGTDHAVFAPGPQSGAREALGLGSGPLALFVGRIQPLKGIDVAVRAVAASRHKDLQLVAIGGASGVDGPAELARVRTMIDDLGIADRVRFIDPQPHHILSTWYRAADLMLVPSRSESFGLVALEAGACGLPVVAAAVGGLRTLVEDGNTGFLIDERDPARYASAIDRIIDTPTLAAALRSRAAHRAADYTWTGAAENLRELYEVIIAGALVECGV
ncbi:MAG: glycosyltransferase [Actinomycetia bacterium]|nr:glycosyltransferase [Actinomycetes bacterium]MCP4084138.1 glycosyltransferase [Actinomycetes bacterium]